MKLRELIKEAFAVFHWLTFQYIYIYIVYIYIYIVYIAEIVKESLIELNDILKGHTLKRPFFQLKGMYK